MEYVLQDLELVYWKSFKMKLQQIYRSQVLMLDEWEVIPYTIIPSLKPLIVGIGTFAENCWWNCSKAWIENTTWQSQSYKLGGIGLNFGKVNSAHNFACFLHKYLLCSKLEVAWIVSQSLCLTGNQIMTWEIHKLITTSKTSRSII